MARLKKCTEKDISVLLEINSSSDTEGFNESYKPSKDTNNSDSSCTSSSEIIFDNNKSLLLRNNALRKQQASLRLKLRRSTEQSIYKIDTDSDDNKPKRLTRGAKHHLKKLQDESQMMRRSARITKLPKKYSDYECVSSKPQTPVEQREHVDSNQEESPPISTTNAKKKNGQTYIINNDSDSDCICVEFLPKSISTRSNVTSRNSKRNRISSHEDVDSDTPLEVRIRSSKRTLTNKKSKTNDTNKSSSRMDQETIIHPKADAIQEIPLVSTPRRRSQIRRKTLPIYHKHESALQEDENKDEIDEISSICEVTKDMSIKTRKQRNRNAKNATKSSPTIQDGLNTPRSRVSLKCSSLTPSVRMRTSVLTKPATPLQEVRSRLHVSAVPKSLPCREQEFNSIYSFLEGKLTDNRGGCIYISGVPGTGKTATVNEVVKCLKRSAEKDKIDHFDFVEVNGMKLSEPRQTYVQILKQLSGKVLTWEQAYNALEKRFNSRAKRPMTLLLVDELDLLCTKRQDVVYNLLDWPTKASAQLVVITIANTMDLPERVLMSRVTSRLGLTRVTFQPYNYKELQEIVLTRLKDTDVFKSEAIQLIARKISAVSGDARRALDICRRAAEITEMRDDTKISMEDVNQALSEMIANPKVQAIKHCSKMEQIFLQAVQAEIMRTGVEEIYFKNVYKHFESLCSFDGLQTPNISESLGICARLGSSRLLICEDSRNDIHQRILLNVSKDDIHYALQQVNLD